MIINKFFLLAQLLTPLTISPSNAADRPTLLPTQNQPALAVIRTQPSLPQPQVIQTKDFELCSLAHRLPKEVVTFEYKNKCYLELLNIHQDTTYQLFIDEDLYLIKFTFSIDPKSSSDFPLSNLYEHKTLSDLFKHFSLNLQEDMARHSSNPIIHHLLEKEKSPLPGTSTSLPSPITQPSSEKEKRRKHPTQSPITRSAKRNKVTKDSEEAEVTTMTPPASYDFMMQFRNPRHLGLTSISLKVQRVDGLLPTYNLPYLKDKLDTFILKPCFNLVYHSLTEALADINYDTKLVKQSTSYHM